MALEISIHNFHPNVLHNLADVHRTFVLDLCISWSPHHNDRPEGGDHAQSLRINTPISQTGKSHPARRCPLDQVGITSSRGPKSKDNQSTGSLEKGSPLRSKTRQHGKRARPADPTSRAGDISGPDMHVWTGSGLRCIGAAFLLLDEPEINARTRISVFRTSRHTTRRTCG